MDRKALLEKKLRIQRVKNILNRLEGIEILELYDKEENEALNNLFSRYRSIMRSASTLPYSKISYCCSESQRNSWIITEMDLKEEQTYFFLCELIWAKIKIVDLPSAVKSLWEHQIEKGRGTLGFLLADASANKIMEASLDSRDEYHYLIDIWKDSQDKV